MSIVLDTQMPGCLARRIVMRRGQVATFGSDAWCDFSFPAEGGLTSQHFRIDCRSDRCELVVLDPASEVLQNEMPVRTAVLRSGDRLTVGPTVFHVQFDGLEAEWSTRPRPLETPRFEVTTAEACRGVEFDPIVSALIQQHASPLHCLDALVAADQIDPAIRVLAAVLPPRAAIWWMFDLLQPPGTAVAAAKAAAAATASDGASSEDRAAHELAGEVRSWIIAPTEPKRRRIEDLLQTADRQHPMSWLGWAVFWSGPSLAPENVPAVPPPVQLVGTGVATAARLWAARNPVKMQGMLRETLDRGRAVMDGQRPWPAV
jgi:hypothetical protein